jgi:hypothetical protein
MFIKMLIRLKQQLKQRQQAVRVMTKLDEIKKIEREKVKAGIKKPYFIKNSTKKQFIFDDRFQELKREGKLKKYMDKKQHKDLAKGRKWAPTRRVDDESSM